MKSFVAIGLLLAVTYVQGAAYTTKYDNIDLDEILNNERLLQNYYKCIMDEGNCTPDGAELKKVLPGALKTKCEDCSEKQRNGASKVLRFLFHKRPEMWTKLEEKYDPDHQYRTLYKEEAEKEGISIAR